MAPLALDSLAFQRASRGLHRELGAILSELTRSGWVVESADGPASMDDIELQLSRGKLRVWLLHDRGTPLIETGSSDWAQTFPVTVWREWLSHAPLPARLPIEVEARMFGSDLEAVEISVYGDLVTPEELQAIGMRQLATTPPWGEQR